jgi:hypothetical protein
MNAPILYSLLRRFPARRSTRRAHILTAMILCLLLPGLASPVLGGLPKPRVRTITVKKLTVSDDKGSKVKLAIEISGDGLADSPRVSLVNLTTGESKDATIVKHDQNKIFASIELPVEKDPAKYEFSVTVGEGKDRKSAIPEGHGSDFTVEVRKEEDKPAAPLKAKPLEITFDTFTSKEYPSLHSVLITNKNKEISDGFSTNPALMKVDILPPGGNERNHSTQRQSLSDAGHVSGSRGFPG